MSRREAWLSAIGVFVVALVIRAATARGMVFLWPEDSAYYVGVARNVAEGRGLVSDALWSYGTPPLVFPRPAFEVWLPVPSLLAAIPMALFAGPAPISLENALRSAQLVMVPLGALVAVLAWRLAADLAVERRLSVGRARALALGTGLTAAVYLPLVLHSVEPDSTIPFGVLALGACLLMTRVLRDPRGAHATDPRLIGLGLLLGAAALTRNEAAWIALAWAWLAWRVPGLDRAARTRLVGVVAVVSILVFAPWAVRDWQTFGSPLPGQALANALSVNGRDIFAWQEHPTLARYLAAGPAELAGMRIDGVIHNVLNVLLLLGIPLSGLGLAALPWQARDRALRPVVLVGGITFLVTSLVFPVATTWGTFLHAAVPVHVLLIVAALAAADGGLARLGRRLGWTRPVAWLGPVLGVVVSAVLSAALAPTVAAQTQGAARTYATLAAELDAHGGPLDGSAPVITDVPIWLAESSRVSTLALPDESPSSVLDLATHFGARWLVLTGGDRGDWPPVLGGADPAAACFVLTSVPVPANPDDAAAIHGVRLYRIGCP